jgi:hypothetical protein
MAVDLDANSQPAFDDSIPLPRPDEIHSFESMPTWIQYLYSQVTLLSTRVKTHDDQLQQIQELLKRNQVLQMALDKANATIAQLEASANRSVPATSPAITDSPPVSAKRADGTSASKWADLAAKPPATDPITSSTKPKSSKTKATTMPKATNKPKAKRPLTLEQLDRFYSPPSDTHGYQFLYFTSRGRERISKIRAGFETLGLSQSRILDIHYPENNTISFLVHNDYASTVIEAMNKLPSSKQVLDFDPCAPTLLRDRKYANNSDTVFLKAEAERIHQDRLLRIAQRLHNPNVKLAVAREFCFKRHWISETNYQQIFSDIYPTKTPKASSTPAKDDVTMDDALASQDSASQPSDTSPSCSPADGVSAPLV